MASNISTIPREVLERIAFELVMTEQRGRPAELVGLLLACRDLNKKLSYKFCPALYARIHKSMFDTAAPHRRFGSKAIRPSNLTSQLRANCFMLQRIRQGDVYSPHVLDDFWLAYVLIMENDGKNRVQLDRAGLGVVVNKFVRSRLWEDAENGWPREKPINALALWLLWCTTTRESVEHEHPAERAELVRLLLPYVVMAFKYPSFHAPDNHLFLPLPEEWQRDDLVSVRTIHGSYPLYREPDETRHTFALYGSDVDVGTPSLTAAAKLIYFSRREVHQLDVPADLPVNRAQANRIGYARQTQADLIEVNTHKGAKFLSPSDWDWAEKLSDEDYMYEADGVWKADLRSPSAQWDCDWERVRYCWDPWSQPFLKGSTYTFGCLDGLFQGRMLVPADNDYFNLLPTMNYPQDFSEMSPFMTTWPVFMRLREHHCINPAVPLLPGGPADDLADDGIQNAWMPAVHCRESDGKVICRDGGDNISEYETYASGRLSSHSADTCTFCIRRREADEQATRERYEARISSVRIEEVEDEEDFPRHEDYEEDFARAWSLPSSSDESDDEEDTLDGSCSGIQDIIITGETDPDHGAAWGRFTFLGRVRPWDGLIALVRIPHGPQAENGHARWVFRGYLHYGQVLVGSWRGAATDPSSIPWEGPFVASRRT